jgi:hypothetical protein
MVSSWKLDILEMAFTTGILNSVRTLSMKLLDQNGLTMLKPFEIIHSWESIEDKNPLLQWTAASIRINSYACNLTYNTNNESKSSHEASNLAMYPLALWFARSWWRLLHETGHIWAVRQKSPYWRLAHELHSAGEGYVWPDITFVSDGSYMSIIAKKTHYSPDISSINYLNEGVSNVPLQDFIDEAAKCIGNVFDRIESSSLVNISLELRAHWDAIREEMSDPEAAQYRKLEAMLGFNPDEADELFMENFIYKSEKLGTGVAEELASATGSGSSQTIIADIESISRRSGITGKFDLPAIPDKILQPPNKPWEIGRQLAIEVRNHCGQTESKISNAMLTELMGVQSSEFKKDTGDPPVSIGIVDKDNDTCQLLFRGHSNLSRRFQASRFIADRLISNKDNLWLPVTTAATNRQKIQRAFAGEFLCPFDQLLSFLDGQYDDDAIFEAAEYFEVNDSVPKTHLVNQGLLTPEILSAVNM